MYCWFVHISSLPSNRTPWWVIDTHTHTNRTTFHFSHCLSPGGGCNRQQSSDRTGPISSMEKGLALLHSVRFVSQTRQRSRFVPFLLRNSTGLPLMFNTLTSVPSKVCCLFVLLYLLFIVVCLSYLLFIVVFHTLLIVCST